MATSLNTIANNRHFLSLSKLIATSSLALTVGHVWGHTPQELPAFATCINAAISHEKQQENPNISNALQACQTELNNLLATVPSGAKASVKEQLTQQVTQMLGE